MVIAPGHTLCKLGKSHEMGMQLCHTFLRPAATFFRCLMSIYDLPFTKFLGVFFVGGGGVVLSLGKSNL